MRSKDGVRLSVASDRPGAQSSDSTHSRQKMEAWVLLPLAPPAQKPLNSDCERKISDVSCWDTCLPDVKKPSLAMKASKSSFQRTEKHVKPNSHSGANPHSWLGTEMTKEVMRNKHPHGIHVFDFKTKSAHVREWSSQKVARYPWYTPCRQYMVAVCVWVRANVTCAAAAGSEKESSVAFFQSGWVSVSSWLLIPRPDGKRAARPTRRDCPRVKPEMDTWRVRERLGGG